jgi:hypothetical protein
MGFPAEAQAALRPWKLCPTVSNCVAWGWLLGVGGGEVGAEVEIKPAAS